MSPGTAGVEPADEPGSLADGAEGAWEGGERWICLVAIAKREVESAGVSMEVDLSKVTAVDDSLWDASPGDRWC